MSIPAREYHRVGKGQAADGTQVTGIFSSEGHTLYSDAAADPPRRDHGPEDRHGKRPRPNKTRPIGPGELRRGPNRVRPVKREKQEEEHRQQRPAASRTARSRADMVLVFICVSPFACWGQDTIVYLACQALFIETRIIISVCMSFAISCCILAAAGIYYPQETTE